MTTDIQVKKNFQEHQNLLKMTYLNTVSVVSSFYAFKCLIKQKTFGIICLIETWLTDNKHLLEYAQPPNYSMTYNNRLNKLSGNVRMYI